MLEIQRGRLERGATLLGAAEALRDSIDSHMTPQERAECERRVAALREGLPAVDLDTAWKKGRSLAMEEAVQFALGG